MRKPLKDKQTLKSAPPKQDRGPKLNTIAEVLAEMAEVYRSAKRKKLNVEIATKLVYMLTQIRQGHEGRALEELQDRLAELSAKVGAQRG
jgi:hypothetical protein